MTAEQKLTFDSKERVTLDLMKEIIFHEDIKNHDDVRAYYLKLYSECLSVVKGYKS